MEGPTCRKHKEENVKEHTGSFVTQGLGLSCGALRPHRCTSAFLTASVQAPGKHCPASLALPPNAVPAFGSAAAGSRNEHCVGAGGWALSRKSTQVRDEDDSPAQSSSSAPMGLMTA